MLQQEQRVADKLLLPHSNDLLLDSHCFRVGDPTEMEEVDVHDKLQRKQPSLGARLPSAIFLWLDIDRHAFNTREAVE
jgi:hypothetical protein